MKSRLFRKNGITRSRKNGITKKVFPETRFQLREGVDKRYGTRLVYVSKVSKRKKGQRTLLVIIYVI